jgi:hypothetical protein
MFLLGALWGPQARADGVALGTAANFAVLYEGGGSGNHLNITKVTVNGNVGVGGTGLVAFSGPGTINGELDFSAGNTGRPLQRTNCPTRSHELQNALAAVSSLHGIPR